MKTRKYDQTSIIIYCYYNSNINTLSYLCKKNAKSQNSTINNYFYLKHKTL